MQLLAEEAVRTRARSAKTFRDNPTVSASFMSFTVAKPCQRRSCPRGSRARWCRLSPFEHVEQRLRAVLTDHADEPPAPAEEARRVGEVTRFPPINIVVRLP